MKITNKPKNGQFNLVELESAVAQARAAGLNDRSVVTVRVGFKSNIKELSIDGDTLSYQSLFEQSRIQNEAQADATPDTSEFR